MALPRIVLNMIVKDEAPIICAFLDRVKPFIDAWAIMDTGSSDDTPVIIEKELASIPGRLDSMPWKGFEASRNAAIDLAQDLGDYLLFLDADDLPVLTASLDEFKAQLTSDLHHGMLIEQSGTVYPRIVFARNGSHSRYRGVVHEVLIPAAGERVGPTITGFSIHRGAIGQGNRSSRGLAKFKGDAELLEKAIAEDRDPDFLERYRFYLAQSYRDFGDIDRALENYNFRFEMPGGYQQERYIAGLNVGHLLAQQGAPLGDVVMAYLRARELDPKRSDAHFHIAVHARTHKMWHLAYEHAVKARDIVAPANSLFLDFGISSWKAQFEISMSAWHVGEYEDGYRACVALIQSPSTPESIRDVSKKNLELYAPHVSLGSATDATSAAANSTAALTRSVTLIERHQFDEAISILQSALSEQPDSPPLLYNMGVALQFSSRLAEAETYYSKAIALDTNFVNALYNRGLVRRDLGDLNGALADLERAYELKPDWDAARINLQAVLDLNDKTPSTSQVVDDDSTTSTN